jgi:hypothetical protein
MRSHRPFLELIIAVLVGLSGVDNLLAGFGADFSPWRVLFGTAGVVVGTVRVVQISRDLADDRRVRSAGTAAADSAPAGTTATESTDSTAGQSPPT